MGDANPVWTYIGKLIFFAGIVVVLILLMLFLGPDQFQHWVDEAAKTIKTLKGG